MASKPSRFFSRLGKKAIRNTIYATHLGLIFSLGTLPVFAISNPLIDPESSSSSVGGLQVDLAQATDGNSILRFATDSYSVRIFREAGDLRMNVFDAPDNLLRLDGGATTEGVDANTRSRIYTSTGSYQGNTAVYQVTVNSPDDIRLTIAIGAGRDIIEQDAQTIAVADLPPAPEDARQDTTLRFDTEVYSVRVFRRGAQSFMNVYNRFADVTDVNGAAANITPNAPPYERAVSYVSSGERNGRPVRYFARILSSGEGLLEIYNLDGQLVLQDSSVGLVAVNIPAADLPQGFESEDVAVGDFVAAVFGDENTLAKVKERFPDARFADSRLGPFINAGNFNNENSAAARVLELRGMGLRARVIFRDTDYR